MSKFSRIVVLVTALASLFAETSSTAGAVTWTNTGATTFHATGGSNTLGVTGSGGTNNFSCPDYTLEGTFPDTFTAVTITETETDCLISGTPSHEHCHYTLTPVSQTATVPAVTTGTAHVTCSEYVAGIPLCHIEGSRPFQYINPNLASGVAARLTWPPSNTLRVTSSNGGSSCSALLGTFSSGIGHTTEHTSTLTGAASVQPFIVRDA